MAIDRDDRWGEDDRDDRPAARPPVDVRSKVLGPAIGLMATGVITLGLLAYGLLFQGGDLDAALDEQIVKIDNDPNTTADQKKMQKDIIEQMRGPMKILVWPMYALLALTGIVLIYGGYKMKTISGGRSWPMTASILAIIPCFSSYACVLGLPIGIWALVVLFNPDVKAAFARSARRGTDQDLDEGWGAGR